MASEAEALRGPGSRGRPWLRALVIGLAVLATAIVLLEIAAASSPGRILRADYRTSSTVLALILAYTTAVHSTHRGDLNREPILALLAPTDPARDGWPPAVSRGRELAAMSAGSLIGIVVIPLFQSDPGFYFRAESWDLMLGWSITVNVLLFAGLGTLALHGWTEDAYLEQRVVPHIPIDLLDLGPLSAFGRRGVITASFWLIGSSLASLLFVSYPFSIAHATIITGTLAIGAGALLRPIRGIQRRILATKREELARIRDALRAERSALLEPGERGRNANARIPGLISWEQRIGDVSTWPIDVSSSFRFGALGALAVGSWIGGAVIERFLEAALG